MPYCRKSSAKNARYFSAKNAYSHPTKEIAIKTRLFFSKETTGFGNALNARLLLKGFKGAER